MQVKAQSAIIDGEITAIDEDGLPCFEELRKTRRFVGLSSTLLTYWL